jgi:hypothetical protein
VPAGDGADARVGVDPDEMVVAQQDFVDTLEQILGMGGTDSGAGGDRSRAGGAGGAGRSMSDAMKGLVGNFIHAAPISSHASMSSEWEEQAEQQHPQSLGERARST